MSKALFLQQLQNEINRIDSVFTTKRKEIVIEGFALQPSPRALINNEQYLIFNSNDYLGLRLHPQLKKAEHEASETYGTGPGAVRFISGTLKVHKELENALARFHGKEDAIVLSSAFAANMAILFTLLKGQSKDSVIEDSVLVISDELNHRSIIDGIRIANLPKENKTIFRHMDATHLREILSANLGKFQRIVIVTDGVFSMLGEFQKLDQIKKIVDEFDSQYPMGVLLVVDDAHGVGAFGKTGRGTEEVTGVQADILVGTLGKAFGADGGYITGPKTVIEYLRESAAPYIYSNTISPGTAGAGLQALRLLETPEGKAILKQLETNLQFFKEKVKALGFALAVDSIHPIQALLIGDTAKTKQLKEALYGEKFLVTNINYPVVPKGRDEIRVQISAAHTQEDIESFLSSLEKVGKNLGLIS